MIPAEKTRYARRSSAGRVSSDLKDNHGGSGIRVRGSDDPAYSIIDKEHTVCLTSVRRVKGAVLPDFRISDEILTYNSPLSDIIITIL